MIKHEHSLRYLIWGIARGAALQLRRNDVVRRGHDGGDQVGNRLRGYWVRSALVQPSCLDEAHNLLPRKLIIVLLLAIIERDQFLSAVDHALDVHTTFGKP